MKKHSIVEIIVLKCKQSENTYVQYELKGK